MSSPAQIAANRRNAQKSTGPRTPSGKAASSLNAVKSAIHADTLVIRGESPDDLARLTAEYHEEFHPVTPRERDLVDTMVRNEWIVRRMGVVEAQLWRHQFQHSDSTLPSDRFDLLTRNFPLGHAFSALSASFERLQRRVSALERSTRRAQQELTQIRRERAALAALQLTDEEPTSDSIGFVPRTASSQPESLIPNPQPLIPRPPRSPHNPFPQPSSVGNANTL